MAQQNIIIGTANAGGGDTPFAAWTKAQANFTELYPGGIASSKLIPTAEKTANYTAVAGDLVLCDATSSAFTITLPTAPADLTRIGVKIVKPVNATVNTITIALGGSDHINRTTGATSTTLTRLGRTLNFQYKSSTAVWYVTESDEALEKSVKKVYNVEYYGAVHDGQTTSLTVNDGTMTSGSAILTSAAGAVFTSSDVNKVVLVSGAGAAGVPLKGTIISFQNSGQVTLSVNASTSVTTSNIVWGTDDTVAIQTCWNACYDAGGGDVFMPKGIYIINGPVQTSVFGANPNSQLYVKQSAAADNPLIRKSITISGECNIQIPLSLSATPSWTGTILYSTLTTNAGLPAVISGVAPSNQFGFDDTYFEKFNIRVYTNKGANAPYISGLQGRLLATGGVNNVSASIDVPLNNSTTPLGSSTIGIQMSSKLNNGPIFIRGGCTSGFETGWVIGEHALLEFPFSIGNYNGIQFLSTFFAVTGKVLVHYCNTQFVFENGAQNIALDLMADLENELSGTGKWFDSVTLISDPGNKSCGTLRYTHWGLSGFSGGTTGASGLHIIDQSNFIPKQFNFSLPQGVLASTGVNNSVTNNVFELYTGVSTSNSTNVAGLSIATNQTGTSTQPLGFIEFKNAALGGDKRQYIFGVYTNGSTSTSQLFEYVFQASVAIQARNVTSLSYDINLAHRVLQQTMTVSWAPALIVTPGAHTGMTTATEFPNFRFDGATQTAASGTTATQRNAWIKRATYAGTSGTRTITNAYGLYVEDSAAGTNGVLTNNYAIGTDGNIAMVTAGNKIFIKEGTNGSLGQTTLVAGTKAITITGVTTSTRAFFGFVAQGGTTTTTWQYKMVCTANTLTITAIDNTGTINTLDTSTLNYFLIEPAP